LTTFDLTYQLMLSVLIPVFHCDPFALVRDLQQQLEQSGIVYEILIGDDTPSATKPDYQVKLEQSPHVIGTYRQQPLGRSANRNRLAQTASYPFLLFIDGDAAVPGPGFIERYVSRLQTDRVLVGGTLYHPQKPSDPALELRWKYGRSREEVPAAKRRLHAWKSFTTFNFCIPAQLFHAIRFDEGITGYGHEDTLFGFQLNQMGVPVEHLDNGLLHLGLEPAEPFLDKVDESVVNLMRLYHTGVITRKMAQDIRLLNQWIHLKQSGLDWLNRILFGLVRKALRKRLLRPNPPLLALDLYKLGMACRIG